MPKLIGLVHEEIVNCVAFIQFMSLCIADHCSSIMVIKSTTKNLWLNPDSLGNSSHQVECVSSSCSSTSESDDVPNRLSAGERAKMKVENFKSMLQEMYVLVNSNRR